MYRTFDSLSQKLSKPNNGIDIAVLAAADREELCQILTLGDLLSDIRIVLILPDKKPDTIPIAHTLGPRFLTYLNSDFEEIKSVLSRMLKNPYSRQIQAKKKMGSVQNPKGVRIRDAIYPETFCSESSGI